jgi:hypothetical protein
MPNGSISASGLNRNPQNIYIYSSGYDPTPFLTSNNFSIFEMASSLKVLSLFMKSRPTETANIFNGFD